MASPYPKAETRRRLLAGLADGSICLLTALQTVRSENLQILLLGVLYAGLRDGISGRSLGKLLCGLTVIRLDGGTPIGPTRSLARNVVFLVPGLNLAALGWEALLLARDPHGFRLGDRLANTQVVEGATLKELAREVQDQLLTVLARMEERLRGRGRSPTSNRALTPSRDRSTSTRSTSPETRRSRRGTPSPVRRPSARRSASSRRRRCRSTTGWAPGRRRSSARSS